MPNAPYPPYPPNLTKVVKVGGFNRTCFVVDICTEEPLTSAQLVQLEDQIALTVERFRFVYKSDIVGPNRFITPLRAALRLE
jgi:hypothetical protein